MVYDIHKYCSPLTASLYLISDLYFCKIVQIAAYGATYAGVRGFGCPFNQYQCNSHCQSIGMRAGYCAGPVKLTCTCTR